MKNIQIIIFASSFIVSIVASIIIAEISGQSRLLNNSASDVAFEKELSLMKSFGVPVFIFLYVNLIKILFYTVSNKIIILIELLHLLGATWLINQSLHLRSEAIYMTEDIVKYCDGVTYSLIIYFLFRLLDMYIIFIHKK